MLTQAWYYVIDDIEDVSGQGCQDDLTCSGVLSANLGLWNIG